ncbi:SurA N-terminal domain-containing protein [Niveibacterium sp. SC-1]|uniref:SurA N-terminal domain-containing protein n=1 Tax=Niveibacterium sp. SC-1 TaxID=3135646 RepID=UPI00311F17F0
MFDAVRNSKRIVQIFLALITIPFGLWGVESYIQNASRNNYVAKVGSSEIGLQEYQQALREEQDRLRQQMGAAFDPEMLQHAEYRDSVADGLVNQRLIQLQVGKDRLRVPPEAVRETIAAIPAFQENGKFSMSRYEQLIGMRGMTPALFESRLSGDLAQQQLVVGVARSVVVPDSVVDRWLTLQDEVRDVSVWQLPIDRFIPQVKLAEGAAQKTYDADKKRWEAPEQVRVEYLALSQQALADKIQIADDAARKQYDDHKERYAAPEERQARHILINAPKDDSADKRKAAKDRAEALLKEVRAKPERFVELAKANSQDSGSAPSGGDLGFFGRGAMVKPFEDAAFKLKPNEISGVVETEFGYHIIQLVAVKGGGSKPFDEVKPQIVQELKLAEASKRFAEQADTFSNLVYEQSDTFKPAAEKLGLTAQQSGWLGKGQALPAPFDNPKLGQAIFSSDAINKKSNSEAIDIGNGTLVSVRVTEHKPVAIRPFAEVRAQIEKELTAAEALKLATAEGERQLAALNKGETVAGATWSEPLKVSRGRGGLPPDLTKAVFRSSGDKLPTYAGAAVPGAGYALLKVSAVQKPALAKEDPRRVTLAQQYARVLGDEDLRAYVKALRERYPVKVNEAAVMAK